jgi:hypothetical protein
MPRRAKGAAAGAEWGIGGPTSEGVGGPRGEAPRSNYGFLRHPRPRPGREFGRDQTRVSTLVAAVSSGASTRAIVRQR